MKGEPWTWAILTGEYPPSSGGVSDYAARVAEGLASRGHTVHVWAPTPSQGRPPTQSPSSDVKVHWLPGHFGPRSLMLLDRQLADLQRECDQPVRLFVQYVPHAFGYKALNVAFCSWMILRGRRYDPWVMFHEVAYPWVRPLLNRGNIVAGVNRVMAGILCRASEHILVSTPRWGELLARINPRGAKPEWLPIPSNFETQPDPALVSSVRDSLLAEGQKIVGHFSGYGPLVREPLRQLLVPFLREDDQCVGYLMGRGGRAFLEEVCHHDSDLRGRLQASGDLPAEEVASHLAACDLLLQPYPDGVTTRRTSLMAGLAVGVPVLTTLGPWSEDVWERTGAVGLYPVGDVEAGLKLARSLLGDRESLLRLGARGGAVYRDTFSLRRTLATLENDPSGRGSTPVKGDEEESLARKRRGG